MKKVSKRTLLFILAIIFAILIQILIYSIKPFSSGALVRQTLYSNLFYIPLLLIIITFPRLNSIRQQIIAINILVFCLILATMNVDFQVLRIFNLPEILPPEVIGTYVWDKTYNLYWVAWQAQWSIVFVIFALIYRFKTDDTWTSVRIGAVGPLIALFSLEDILYYPLHGENPFNISSWSWLPQHNIYFGRPVTTTELIWIVSVAMIVIFLFLVGFFLKKNAPPPLYDAFSSSKEKRRFFWIAPLTLGLSVNFVLLYLNTNIINNRIPLYLLLFFVVVIGFFIFFSSYFPKIKSIPRQLILIFGCYLIFWIAATEMDWHAVEAGFHWIVPGDPRKPPGNFWIWCDYRMAMWLIYLPTILLLISLLFKFLGNSKEDTLKLGVTNYLICFSGIDTIIIFLIARGGSPPHWSWSNLHYSLLGQFYTIPVIIVVNICLGFLLYYIYKRT
ncbi:MAG: hypothetical protein ACTSQI_04075 [Candidatus Helarchaeota archaeon]